MILNKSTSQQQQMGNPAAPHWKQLLLSSINTNSHLKHSSYFQLVLITIVLLPFNVQYIPFASSLNYIDARFCSFVLSSFQATVASNGRPSNRTVVFRGFQDGSDKVQINTDTRTRKIDDLKHCSFAEICWYFTESWEQFRISGLVDVIDGTNPDPVKLQQREKSWFDSSPKSRLQYMAPTPRLPSISEQQPLESLDPCTGPVGAFCLLILDPDQVDYLNLKSNERLMFTSRQILEGEKLWTSERVNP